MRSPDSVLTPSCEIPLETCRRLIDLAVQAGLESPMEDDSMGEGGVLTKGVMVTTCTIEQEIFCGCKFSQKYNFPAILNFHILSSE